MRWRKTANCVTSTHLTCVPSCSASSAIPIQAASPPPAQRRCPRAGQLRRPSPHLRQPHLRQPHRHGAQILPAYLPQPRPLPRAQWRRFTLRHHLSRFRRSRLRTGSRIKIWIAASLVAVAALVAAGFYLRSRSSAPRPSATALTEKDTVVLADFSNSTSDPVFDGTLKQALAVDLEQSPFLNILSDRKVGETLKLMGRARPTMSRPMWRRSSASARAARPSSAAPSTSVANTLSASMQLLAAQATTWLRSRPKLQARKVSQSARYCGDRAAFAPRRVAGVGAKV